MLTVCNMEYFLSDKANVHTWYMLRWQCEMSYMLSHMQHDFDHCMSTRCMHAYLFLAACLHTCSWPQHHLLPAYHMLQACTHVSVSKIILQARQTLLICVYLRGSHVACLNSASPAMFAKPGGFSTVTTWASFIGICIAKMRLALYAYNRRKCPSYINRVCCKKDVCRHARQFQICLIV